MTLWCEEPNSSTVICVLFFREIFEATALVWVLIPVAISVVPLGAHSVLQARGIRALP